MYKTGIVMNDSEIGSTEMYKTGIVMNSFPLVQASGSDLMCTIPIQEASYYFPHKTMWRAFFCALVAAGTVQVSTSSALSSLSSCGANVIAHSERLGDNKHSR
jgi:hypothetical protein